MDRPSSHFEMDKLNKIVYFDEYGSKFDDSLQKRVIILNNFEINPQNLEKLELVIHQLRTEAEGELTRKWRVFPRKERLHFEWPLLAESLRTDPRGGTRQTGPRFEEAPRVAHEVGSAACSQFRRRRLPVDAQEVFA